MDVSRVEALPQEEVSQHQQEQVLNLMDLYGNNKENLIQILHGAQQIVGHIPLTLQILIAENLKIPVSDVSGVVSFYSFFSATPRGKHIIRVCLGTACYVRGGKKLVETLQSTLQIGLNETTEDGKFTLEIARCIGACGLAPAMMIDDVVYRQVNPNKIDSILQSVEGGTSNNGTH
jgi:NADH:ubiquinone oxidoreductase subunit E